MASRNDAIHSLLLGKLYKIEDDEIVIYDKSLTKPTESEIANEQTRLENLKIEHKKNKEALFERLGITADEAKILLSQE